MSYSEFTLSQLESEFNLILQQRVELFKSIESVNPSALLKEILAENIPLALEIDIEKARSELIISPIIHNLLLSRMREKYYWHYTRIVHDLLLVCPLIVSIQTSLRDLNLYTLIIH
ncbi:MAG: hypothetical protein MGG11_16650 [Trichodesmium sp. MAG_R03]|nr:hypothetical protein [Trichodesmium sp. MAG_R03]